MPYSSHAESHVPRFQERVGTKHPGYMIPDRLPWRHRARPSATLHEIQVRSTIKLKSGLVLTMLQNAGGGVKGKLAFCDSWGAPSLLAFFATGLGF